MKRMSKTIVIIAVVAVAAGIVAFKQLRPAASRPDTGDSSAVVAQASVLPANETASLPLLLDLGATSCVPCKMMAPILDDLEKEYVGRMQVRFIDVWKDEGAGQSYGIRAIPTQIFFDADRKELFRHEGFYSREQILGKWKELGYSFE